MSVRRPLIEARLIDVLPELVAEIEQGLRTENEEHLIPQLAELRITGRCGCGEFGCCTFDVTGGTSPLSEEKQRACAEPDAFEVCVDADGPVLDIDRLERIIGIEIFNRDDVTAVLESLELPQSEQVDQ